MTTIPSASERSAAACLSVIDAIEQGAIEITRQQFRNAMRRDRAWSKEKSDFYFPQFQENPCGFLVRHPRSITLTRRCLERAKDFPF